MGSRRGRTVNELVQYISERLSELGVEVEVLPAETTSSKYLTLDRGVLSCVRVSDHRGGSFRYTYDIGPHIETKHRVVRTDPQGEDSVCTRYPESGADDLIETVLCRRLLLVSEHSRDGYKKMVRGTTWQDSEIVGSAAE